MDCEHEIILIDDSCQDCGLVYVEGTMVVPPQESILVRAWDNVG